jgi:2-iminoacetate synthase
VQPLSQEEDERLHEAGVYSVLVYQKRIIRMCIKSIIQRARNPILILDWIPRPHWESGIHKIDCVLLGLEDWRTDSFNALPGLFTKNLLANQILRFFPRLRPAEGTVPPNFIMDDRDLTQLVPIVCGTKIWNFDFDTRE